MKISVREVGELLEAITPVVAGVASRLESRGGLEAQGDGPGATLAELIAARFAALEQRVSAIEAQLAPRATTTTARRAGRPRKSAASKANGAQPSPVSVAQ